MRCLEPYFSPNCIFANVWKLHFISYFISELGGLGSANNPTNVPVDLKRAQKGGNVRGEQLTIWMCAVIATQRRWIELEGDWKLERCAPSTLHQIHSNNFFLPFSPSLCLDCLEKGKCIQICAVQVCLESMCHTGTFNRHRNSKHFVKLSPKINIA